MSTWLAVGAGGALGAMARHALALGITRMQLAPGFPLGIFAINVAGSAALGMVTGLLVSGRLQMPPDARTFVIVGVVGGFTTFSTFSLDTLLLLRAGQPLLAALNVAGQVGVSLAAVAVGYRLAS